MLAKKPPYKFAPEDYAQWQIVLQSMSLPWLG
jgi:hypothetical protein